jgi:formylmethanofuran dehydrogenase subunit E
MNLSELTDADLIAFTAPLVEEPIEPQECSECHELFTPNRTKVGRQHRCPRCAKIYQIHHPSGKRKKAEVAT